MTPERSFAPEIQGLRAIAVALVVVFHVWPTVLRGGYVGVDVFFVISGYLITGLLVRQVLRHGRISLIDFYSRRARRLLPAATAVLVATLVGMLWFLPESRWRETSVEIAASALYVQNWVLAWLSVDYLGAEQAASPVQHFWSLAIEEQFYVLWPLVMIGALSFARRRGLSIRRTFLVALAVIFTVSLAASIIVTSQEPALAYFVTHTRLWELALGGLVALTIHRIDIRSPRLRALLVLIGLSAVLWSAIAYSTATPFPGLAALVPTLGTALIIIAGDVRLGAFKGLNATWLSYVGDRSYSIYLWHWPLIVFYTVRVDSLGPADGLALVATTILVSHFSYKYIEERYRHARAGLEWRPLGYGLASILVIVMGTMALQFSLDSGRAVHAVAKDPNYPGPAAILTGAITPDGVDPIPSLSALRSDMAEAYVVECHVPRRAIEPNPCILNSTGDFRITLVGDSHAANWIPALQQAAVDREWVAKSHTKSGCPFLSQPTLVRGEPYVECDQWVKAVLDEIRSNPPDVILWTMSNRNRLVDQDDSMPEAIAATWEVIRQAGPEIIVIRGTPRLTFEPGDCLSQKADCHEQREHAFGVDPIGDAIAMNDNVLALDMTDIFCNEKTCPVVIGNMVVWRDRHHITATYSRAAGPYLAERIENR